MKWEYSGNNVRYAEGENDKNSYNVEIRKKVPFLLIFFRYKWFSYLNVRKTEIHKVIPFAKRAAQRL